MSFINALQNLDTKSLLWSLMISSGHLFLQYHLSKNRNVKSSTDIFAVQGAICMSAPRWSIMVTIVSKPSSFGNGPMKSIATESNCLSGTGNGWRGPAVLDVEDLLH